MQSLARKNEWPLDKMTLTVDVTKKFKEEFNQPAREGAYVYGLYMEGSKYTRAPNQSTDRASKTNRRQRTDRETLIKRKTDKAKLFRHRTDRKCWLKTGPVDEQGPIMAQIERCCPITR